MFYLSLAIAVAGLTVYHLSLKRTPHDVNPLAFLAIGYVLAAAMCILAMRVSDGKMPWRMMNGSLAITFGMLAVGVLLIEIGVLLSYRHGWPLGTVGPVGNALSAAILLPVAVIVFKDRVGTAQIVGLVLVLVGLLVMSKKAAV